MKLSLRRTAYTAVGLIVVGIAACTRGPGGGSTGQLQIRNVQVGLRPGPIPASEDMYRRSPMFKAGHWTPVFVEIEGKGKLDNVELVVETVDADDVLNNYATKLGALDFSAENPSYKFVTYARPGKAGSSVNVYLRSGDGENLCPPSEQSPEALDASHYLYVTLGARLPGLRLPGGDDRTASRAEVAAIDNVAELPTKWYGYQTADLVILTTGRKEFVSGLFDDSARRAALFEWVRRGGKLVVSAGENYQDLTRETLTPFLPVELEGVATPAALELRWRDFVTGMEEPLQKSAKTTLTLMRMKAKPSRSARIPVFDRTHGPVVVQAPYGLGRVTIVGFDLDKAPFTEWKGQKAFWDKLLRESGPAYSTHQADPDRSMMMRGAYAADNEEVIGQLQRSLETFDGVPVISFGWIALFILVYILIVGPLDYFFLKKVVKRLELTWVTFPLVVVIVSAAAYFTAYAIKGDDQKINKFDVIDIDMQTRTAHGAAWFFVFSPRIQNYTVGVEAAEGWGIKADAPLQAQVSWLGALRKERQSLFRRSYDYTEDAGGLKRVPIQVWSTKGFQATWQAPLADKAEPVRSNLQDVNGTLTGVITSNLPVVLKDAVLFHRGKVYYVNDLLPGTNKVVTTVNSRAADSWVADSPGTGIPGVTTQGLVRSMLFSEMRDRTGSLRAVIGRNGGLREFDQSWRLRPEDPGEEAMLVGRVESASGLAADVANKPASVTRLWLGALPSPGVKPPTVNGALRQETFVRAFLPVKPARK